MSQHTVQTEEIAVREEGKFSPDTAVFFTTTFFQEGAPDFAIITLPWNGHPRGDDEPAEIEYISELIYDAEGWTMREAPKGIDKKELEVYIRHMYVWAMRDRPFLEIKRFEIWKQPFPVMNSPISGKTLAELFAAVGGGLGVYASVPNIHGKAIMTLFLVVGGTKIVIGAADGIGYALKHGLAHLLLKWMGAPSTVIETEKKTQTRKLEQEAAKPETEPKPKPKPRRTPKPKSE